MFIEFYFLWYSVLYNTKLSGLPPLFEKICNCWSCTWDSTFHWCRWFVSCFGFDSRRYSTGNVRCLVVVVVFGAVNTATGVIEVVSSTLAVVFDVVVEVVVAWAVFPNTNWFPKGKKLSSAPFPIETMGASSVLVSSIVVATVVLVMGAGCTRIIEREINWFIVDSFFLVLIYY